MAFDYGVILEITTIPTDSSAVYTLPAATTAYIRFILIHNSNTTAETVELWAVPNGSAADDTTEIFHDVVAAGQSVQIEYPTPGYILETAGDAIHGDTTTVSKVTISIMGGLDA